MLCGLHTVASADRLVDTRQVTKGDFLAPRFSPDGRELLLTGPKLRGLHVVSIAGGAVRQLTDEPEAGVHARWTGPNSIAYRANRAGARRDLVIDKLGVVKSFIAAKPLAFAQDDRMYVVDRTGATKKIGTGDRFFGAVVSPDGDKVVFQGLVTGLHVYVRSTSSLRHIGPGSAPTWTPDSTRVVYEVTQDDGHMIVASDLFAYAVATDRASQLTTTDAVIERHPSVAADGVTVAFDDDAGGVYVGRMEVR